MQTFNELVELVGYSPEKLSKSGLVESKHESEDVSIEKGYRYISYFKKGVSFCICPEEGVVKSAYLYGLGKELFDLYTGELPSNITFGDTETEIVQKLGYPSESGEKEEPYNNKFKYLRYRKGTVLMKADLILYLYPGSGLLMVEVIK